MNGVFSRRYEIYKAKTGFASTFYCDLYDGTVTPGVIL